MFSLQFLTHFLFREWDVCAGIVIAEEAGAVVTGAASAFSELSKEASFDVTPEILTGRKYLVVRAIHGEGDETPLDAQKRIIGEFYGCVDDIDID